MSDLSGGAGGMGSGGGGGMGAGAGGGMGVPTQVKSSKFGKPTNLQPGQGMGIPTQTQSHKFGQMEEIVRPWVDFGIVPNNPREPDVPELVRPEAYLEWGEGGTFTENDFREEAKGIGFHVDDDEEPERDRYVFSEEGRSTRDYMVVGTEDPESYIVLRVAGQIAFNGPNGEQFRALLSPHMPGTQTGSGQTPPAPPALSEM